MLDRDVIFALVAYLGRSECPFGRAAPFWGGEHVFARLGGGDGLTTLAIQVGDMRFFVVFHADQRRREARDLPLLGDDQRDRLSAEQNPVAMKRPERRTVRSNVVLVGSIGARHARPVLVRE